MPDEPNRQLRAARLELDLTQSKLAKALRVIPKTVARWENGTSRPFPDNLELLCKYLRKSAEELGYPSQRRHTSSDQQVRQPSQPSDTPQEHDNPILGAPSLSYPEYAWKTQQRADEGSNPDLTLTSYGQEQQPQRLWSMLHRRNPFFTGRDHTLKNLHSALVLGKAAISRQVLSGLAGIGKTQIAVEYAYRYHEEYQFIFWAAADTQKALISDFVHIASTLNLPGQDEQDRNCVVDAVIQWLNCHIGWLLILDNVDDANTIEDFVPQDGRGHILVTARDQALGTLTTTINIGIMEVEDGATLLLRRAGVIGEQDPLDKASESDRAKALDISIEMDGLPLALDQAGAFIYEAGCTVAEYFEFYKARRDKLLQDRGRSNAGHPLSLAATILLSFDKVKQVNPVAADVLRLCAYLHPNDIPEELFTEGDTTLEPHFHPVAEDSFSLAEALRELRRYSFVQQETNTKTLSVHRLVQAVIEDEDHMDTTKQRKWAEHAVWVVTRTLSSLEFGAWGQYQRYISQALTCIALIDRWQIFNEATIQLVFLAGCYLRESAMYAEAVPCCLKALDLARKVLGREHEFVVICLNNVATLYENLGDYKTAESYCLEAVAICARKPDPETLVSTSIFNKLAKLYKLEGRYLEAEPLAKKALAARESILGPEHEDVVSNLITLAEIYCALRKYDEAEPVLQRAQAICEKLQEPRPLDVVRVLNSLMLCYTSQGKHQLAEPFCQRILEIAEKERGPRHPDVARIRSNVAEIYRYLGNAPLAEQYCKQALEIFEEVHGPNSPHIIPTLCILALTYQGQGRYPQAESLFKQSQAITAETLGSDHPDMANILAAYASLLREMERYSEADEVDERAYTIRSLWLKDVSRLQLLKEANSLFLRKHIRKGSAIIYNGERIKIE